MHSACKYQKRIFKGFCAPKSWFLTPKDSLMHKICNIILSMQSQKLSKNSVYGMFQATFVDEEVILQQWLQKLAEIFNLRHKYLKKLVSSYQLSEIIQMFM